MERHPSWNIRCRKCNSLLVTLLLTPMFNSETQDKGHIDVKCGVCGAFVLDLWYTRIRNHEQEDLQEILREEWEQLD